jgi:hypothetical protein
MPYNLQTMTIDIDLDLTSILLTQVFKRKVTTKRQNAKISDRLESLNPNSPVILDSSILIIST